MADPVGKLDIQVGFDLDKSSLTDISRQVASFHKTLSKTLMGKGNKDLQPFLPINLKTIGREYKSLTSSLKKTYGFNDKQVKTVIDNYFKANENNAIGLKLAQQAGVKRVTAKNWTLQQLASKSDRYELLKKEYQEEGYTGSSLTKKLNKEFGSNYSQSYEKTKNTKAYKLLEKETRLKQQGLPFLKELGSLKGFSKGLLGVGFAGGIATLIGKAIASYIGGQVSKVEDFGAYGTAELSTLKKSMGVIGGDFWSTEEIEKILTSSFSYMASKTQNIDQTMSELGRLSFATGGRGSKYIEKYADLIAAGKRDGNPRFIETMELAAKIAGDKNLSKTDQRALISHMIGSAEMAEKLMTNAEIGKYDLAELNKEYSPSALAGFTQGKKKKAAAQDVRKTKIDAETKLNLDSEYETIENEATAQAMKEFGGKKGALLNLSTYLKRKNELIKEGVDEKTPLIPAIKEVYKKEMSSYGAIPKMIVNNNFNVSNDYDVERAGNRIIDIINVNLKNSQKLD